MKKTKKVKKKIVKKKKRTVKESARKGSVSKQKIRKAIKSILKEKKKTKKRVKRKKISMEDCYKILNKVQLNKKKVTFATTIEESDVIENVIRDLDLKYDKTNMKTQSVFTIYPNEEDQNSSIFDIEYLEDEIPVDGQIF